MLPGLIATSCRRLASRTRGGAARCTRPNLARWVDRRARVEGGAHSRHLSRGEPSADPLSGGGVEGLAAPRCRGLPGLPPVQTGPRHLRAPRLFGAVMLSAESAAGSYPEESVCMQQRVIDTCEASATYMAMVRSRIQPAHWPSSAMVRCDSESGFYSP